MTAGAGAAGPDPSRAATPEEFVAALRALKDASGLTYRQLSARAEERGDALPHSTLAGSLSRTTLPREEVVVALVRACGSDEAAVAAWSAAYRGIAEGEAREAAAARPDGGAGSGAAPPAPFGGTAPAGGADARTGLPRLLPRSPLAAMAVGGVLVAVAAGLLVALTEGGDGGGVRAPASASPSPADPSPPAGEVRIRAAHTGMCLSEGRERNGRTDRPLAVQRDCAAARTSGPRVRLAAVGDGTYQIQWMAPAQGTACLGVDEGGREDGYLLAPRECDATLPHQRFLFEPVERPEAGGYRVRAAHSGKCLGFVGPVTEEGAELVQASCVGSADQEFFVEAAS